MLKGTPLCITTTENQMFLIQFLQDFQVLSIFYGIVCIIISFRTCKNFKKNSTTLEGLKALI